MVFRCNRWFILSVNKNVDPAFATIPPPMAIRMVKLTFNVSTRATVWAIRTLSTVTAIGKSFYFSFNLTCYNSSQFVCSNNTLCYPQYACGSRCLTDYNSVRVNKLTICSAFNSFNYYYTDRYVNVCGLRETCYDNTTHVCLGSNGTVCSIGSQLCSGLCNNPKSQYCIRGNNDFRLEQSIFT